MEIEVTSSNQLIGSVSTQASNNIKSPIEQKNLNICNTNMIFFPQKKKWFKRNSKSKPNTNTKSTPNSNSK